MTRGQKYYHKNRERLKAYQHERYANDPEFVARRRAHAKQYYKENRERLRAYAKQRWQEDKEHFQEVNRKAEAKRRSTPEGMSKVLVYAARTRCKAKGWKMGVTSADVLAVWPKDNKCPVFGVPFCFGKRGQSTRGHGPSLDRLDSTKGYVRGNIAVISWWANNLKGSATPAELRALADWISKNA